VSSRPIPNPNLRVSDAERQQVADLLKQHATDGRLDAAEFEARLDQTLRAKTRADLAGLLDDLPDLNPPRDAGSRPGPYGYDPGRYGPGPYGGAPGPYGRRAPDRPFFRTAITLGLVLVAFLATLSAISSVARPHFAWLIILIVVLVVWRRGRGYRRWRG
jgi:hypothetical protein